MKRWTQLSVALLLSACSMGRRPGESTDGGLDAAGPFDAASSGQRGCEGELQGCYTVYAHSDHVLYHIDLKAKQLVTVGPFKAPLVLVNGKMEEDVITDLAVAPDDTLYVISRTSLYTADPKDGHVTLQGAVTACGEQAVALTFNPEGELFAADFKGAFCRIDLSSQPPQVINVGIVGGGLALTGDLVAVGDGTMYGTAYNMADAPSKGTQANNLLIKLDPMTGKNLQLVGSTGSPKLYGAAFAEGQVFGFTHDGSGDVVTIDPKTGKGKLYNSFADPDTQKPISFAGAGVNAKVAPTIM